MKKIDTKFAVENVMCCAISDWFETCQVSLEKYPEEYHDVIWSQRAIGWRQVFNGQISKLWLKHQGNTKRSSGQVRMEYIWGASIVETCLCMMIELWELRNKEVHGKEAASLEQKRKERAAITVRELHKLEEQSRPSDSILFYQDVDTTIKRVPATTLEVFIAMKTKAINNSVREWAKQSTVRVRSIIDWIRVRGTNSKEAIDKIEKRQRDFYRHESHKRPRKKKQKKGQYSVFHNATNSSEWIYIPKERLVLIREGTLLSIPITGIKQCLPCSYKSILR